MGAMIIGALAPGPPAPPGRPLAVAAMIVWLLTASIGAYMLRAWITGDGLRRQRATDKRAGPGGTGGGRPPRGKEPGGVPPPVVFGNAGAAAGGLLIWVGFLATGRDPLAWLGVVLIAGAIALGVCTVTLWTPYPVAVPASEESRPRGPKGVWGGGKPLPGGVGWDGLLREEQHAESGGRSFPTEDLFTDDMIADLVADSLPDRQPRLRLLPLIPVVHGFGALTTFMLAVLAAISARLGTFLYQ